jgi:ribonuclease P protein component
LEKEPQYRFRKALKIKRKREISQLFSSGARWKCAPFTILWSENELNHNRCAIVISREFGSAVERNRMKRQVREIFRKKFQNEPRHSDIIVKINSQKKGVIARYELEDDFERWYEQLKK